MKYLPLLLLTPAVIIAAAPAGFGYSHGPLPKLTGGFGEQSCVMCHDSHQLNEGRALGGVFQIDGIPITYAAGQTYPIAVLIGQLKQKRWGFELSARFAESGRQAGRLVPVDNQTQVKEDSGIQYIEHTVEGTRAGLADGLVEFHFNWVAPDPSAGTVLFNAAGNAANFSNDPSGDFIYTAGAWSRGTTETSANPAGAPKTGSLNPESSHERKWGDRINDASRVVDLPAPVHLHKGAFEIHIQHRFLESLSDSSPGDAFGIDSGANINLGVNYAVTDRFSFGVSRARFEQIIAWTGTYEIHTRSESFWKMSLLGGVEGQRNFEQQYSPYLQLATRFDYRGLRLYVDPTAVFHSRNRQAVEQFPSIAINGDSENTFSLGIGGDIALTPRFSLVAEVVPRLAGFGGFGHHGPTVSGGFEIRTWGHVFNILVSSSREFTPAQYAVNPGYDDVSLGFNIYRRIH